MIRAGLAGGYVRPRHWSAAILDRFPDVLTQADHRFRMERLLLQGELGRRQRAAGYAGKDYATLVQGAAGLFQGKKSAEKAFAAVPASLRERSRAICSHAPCYLRRERAIPVEAARS